jgi:hypothetical protein
MSAQRSYSSDAPAAKHSRGRWPWLFGGVGALILLAVSACGGADSTGATAPSPTAARAAPGTAATAAPVAPTAKPAAAPAANQFDKTYGTFAVTSAQGSSDAVVNLPAGAKTGLLTAMYTGATNFVVEQLDSSNQVTDLLVNTIGNYSGVTAFGVQGEARTLKITAGGAWTVKLAAISSAPGIGAHASGSGDAVYLWTGRAANWAISNQGSENFVVQTRDASLFGGDLLVNEIGAYTGTVPVTQGPAVVQITSNGAWTLSVQ